MGPLHRAKETASLPNQRMATKFVFAPPLIITKEQVLEMR